MKNNFENGSRLTIQELKNRLNSTAQSLQQQLNGSKITIRDLQNQLFNTTQTIQEQLVQLQVTNQNIDAKINNSTRLHQQSYLDCKETVLTLNEQTQRNASQQIQLQASKCTEGILSLQLQTNNSNRALDTLTANLTQTTNNIEHKINELETSLNQNTTTDAFHGKQLMYDFHTILST